MKAIGIKRQITVDSGTVRNDMRNLRMLEGAARAGRLGPGERANGHGAAHIAGVGVVTVLVATAYVEFSLSRYYNFRSASYDLVIFDQAVRSYAHFQPGISIIKGLHNGFGPNFSVLGDHFSPILACLAPLYWIHDGPQTLLVAQSVLFALAVPPLWIFTRRAFGGGRNATIAAYLACVAYGLSWAIASAAAADFHEVAFAPVLTAVALERFQAGRLRSALIALAVLLLVKEDMGLLVAGIGCYLAVSRPRVVRGQWIAAVACVVVGVAYTAFAVYVLLPAFGGRADYYWAYSSLGRGVPQAAWHVLTHPFSSLRLILTPGVKVHTLLWLVGAVCFLPLLSPIALAAVPLLLERMLNSKFPNWWVTNFQYNAYLVVVFVFAAVDGAARLDRWATRGWRYLRSRSVLPTSDGADQAADTPVTPNAGLAALACAAAMIAVAVYSVPHFAFGPALHPSFYQRTARTNAAAAAAAAVPSGVTVAAANHVGPHLSARDTVLLWDGNGYTPPFAASWVIANDRRRQFTFSSVRDQRDRIRLLERYGYRIVFRRAGYIVLHRGAGQNGHPTAKVAR